MQPAGLDVRPVSFQQPGELARVRRDHGRRLAGQQIRVGGDDR